MHSCMCMHTCLQVFVLCECVCDVTHYYQCPAIALLQSVERFVMNAVLLLSARSVLLVSFKKDSAGPLHLLLRM